MSHGITHEFGALMGPWGQLKSPLGGLACRCLVPCGLAAGAQARSVLGVPCLPTFLGLPVAALFPVISGHSVLGACQLPCCQSAGHCFASCDLGSLGLGSLPVSALHSFVIWLPVFGCCCILGSLSASDQASVFTRMHELSLGSMLC